MSHASRLRKELNAIRKIDAVRAPRATGRVQLLTREDDGDIFRAVHVQDGRGILELNYEQRKNSDENWQRDEDIKHVGRVPLALWAEWEKIGITEDPVALMRALELESEGRYKTTTKSLR